MSVNPPRLSAVEKPIASVQGPFPLMPETDAVEVPRTGATLMNPGLEGLLVCGADQPRGIWIVVCEPPAKIFFWETKLKT